MFILSVDPASHKCGVALWRDGKFVDSRQLRCSNDKASFSERMRSICAKLDQFLDVYDADVEQVVSERVQDIIVGACIGAILTCARINSKFNGDLLVSPSTWKAWAMKRGAPGAFAKIKGLPALTASGFPHVVFTEDEADAIMVYLSWAEKHANKTDKRRDGKKTT